MNGAKIYISLLLLLCLAGCGRSERSQIKAAVGQELGHLGKGTYQVSSSTSAKEELFSDSLLSEASEVYAKFFEGFRYKVEKINYQKGDDTATAIIGAHTRDGSALAKSYAKAQLREEMLRRATGGPLPLTDEDLYRLLGDLLDGGDIPSLDNRFEMQLQKTGDHWKVSKTEALENALVGGFLSSSHNPYLLTPAETLGTWFDTLRGMDTITMSTYLGLDGFDEGQRRYAAALMGQIKKYFNYQILSTEETSSGSATVQVAITSFCDEAIDEAYRKALREYLSTADAVIDGEEARYENACRLLVECIENNEVTSQVYVSFQMYHDGTSWCLAQNENEDLGQAIFGTLSGTLVSMEETREEEIEEVEEEIEEE
ncbi:MAG: hypothetical protein IIZ39_09680 [Blautia sp.]|nr:hypothetical protein [Blautia sp.]